MLRNRQIIKKILLVLVAINVASALILMKQSGVVENVLSPQNAIAADNDKDAKNEEGKEAVEGEEKAELTDEELAAKDAEEAKIIFEGLETRRLLLKEQEEKILQEQETLKNLKKELEEKIAELEKTHSQINISLEKLDKKKSEKAIRKEAAENKKIKQLVKVYSSMKPKNAGQIINNMDIIVAEKIIRNMKGDAAGKILSYVESSRAAAISERLAATISKKKE